MQEPTDLVIWAWCAIIFLFMSPPGCPVGLSFHPLQRLLLGVASAAGGPSLEAPKDLEWWPCELSVGFLKALNMKDTRLVFAGGLEVGWGVEHNPLEAPRFGLQDGPLAL